MAKYYYQRAGELNRELKRFMEPATLKALHRKRPAFHFFIALRQLGLLILLPLLIYRFPSPWVWIPAGCLLGVVVFSFTVLLHEVVHKCVFKTDRPRLNRWLGYLYGTISGLASAQFKRWHLDHHDQLGSKTDDPKRAHLSPKRVKRWVKFLYCTPALFPIYFKAAKTAQASYTPALRKRIGIERLVSMGFHLGILAFFWSLSPAFALKAHVFPVFFVFPMAFTLNRLGQHYLIDPEDIAKWSTLMRPNAAWNFLFLYSSYHLEHHYFPGVPFYNLKRLHRELTPFFEQKEIPVVNYRQLLKAWFLDNHVPHTKPQSIS